jgi:hypothetical protein
MIERDQDAHSGRTLPTRRGVIASNIKAIGAIMASAVVASLATPASARTPCFLRGTKIRSIAGERNVEDLAVGDLLPTVFGGARPIQWITGYRRTRRGTGKPWTKDARPVCIKSSAIAAHVPHADLFVTAGHALLIDDVLIPAGSLVNGITILQWAAEECDELEFFQIKLENHDVIYAEGAPCESSLTVNQSASNFAEYCREHGISAAPDRHCAPIVCNGARSEIRSRVRSAMTPWLGPQKIDLIRDYLEERAANVVSAGQLRVAPPNRLIMSTAP